MINRVGKVVAVGLFVVSVFVSGGVTVVSAKSLKIAYVDLNRIAEESVTGRALIESFQRAAAEKQKEIDEMRKNVDALEMELKKQSMLLSDTARKEKESDYMRAGRKLKRFVSDSSEEFDRKKSETEKSFLGDILKLTRKIGKEEGYSFILSKEFLIYASENVDITDIIIKKIDKNKIK